MNSRMFDTDFLKYSVFKDLSVLSPHYIPKELPYRKSEIKRITRELSVVLIDTKPSNIFLYGKTGTGKTSVVKNIMRELESLLNEESKNPESTIVKSSYMNCRLGYNSKYQILLKILEQDNLNVEDILKRPLEGVRNNSLSGRSPTQLYAILKKVVEANALHLIVILDEIDMVRDVNELLYMLTRINDQIEHVEVRGKSRRGSVSIIGISNKASFKHDLDPRTKSTLCGEEIVFKPYNAHELKTILTHRVKIGFKKGGISESNIGLIAALAAQTSGDARYALRLLQKSGEIAQVKKRKRVKIDDVKAAKAAVEDDIIKELIITLPEHLQMVLYSITDLILRGGKQSRLAGDPQDGMMSGEVYFNYELVCKHLNRKPRTMRWFGEYLKELEMLGLVTLSISGKGVRGNTTLIRLGSSASEMKKLLFSSLGFE